MDLMNHHYCMHVFWIFPKQCVHTERVSYGRCNGRCFIRAHSGLRHFTCKFPYKVAVVKSWHTFRPRRLAQSVCVGVCVCVSAFWAQFGRGILPVNFRIEWFLWNFDMRFDCAGSHKMCASVLGSFWGLSVFCWEPLFCQSLCLFW